MSDINCLCLDFAAARLLELQNRVDDAGLHVTATFSCSNWGLGPDALLAYQPRDLGRLLEEVDRCRPLFVGLLGEGYGPVPTVVEGGLERIVQEPSLREYGWLAEMHNPHVPGGLRQSLTELEFVYGCLYTSWEAAGSALVYFRNSSFALRQPNPVDRLKYLPRARSEMSLKQSKLASNDLKMRSKVCSGLRNQKYDTPQKGVETILQDVYKIINEIFPLDAVPDEVQKSYTLAKSLRCAHKRILDTSLFEKQLTLLDHCTAFKTNLVIVKGEAGSGKTTFAFEWMERHLIRWSPQDISFCAMCPGGPRQDIRPHLFIATFIHQNLADNSLTGFLRRFYIQLKQSLKLDLRVPTGAGCVAEFELWIGAASNYGLVWIIDGMDQVSCSGFEWMVSTLRGTEHGILLIMTCTPGSAVSRLGDSPDIENVQHVILDKLSPACAWDLQAIYFQSHQCNDVDEVAVTKICDASTSPLHLRVGLVMHRLMLNTTLPTYSATEAIVLLFGQLKTRNLNLYFCLVILSLCNCGLRESELLFLLHCSTRDMWEIRDFLLDDLMVSTWGIMTFKDLSLKSALKEEILKTKLENSTLVFLQSALDFFHSKVSKFRCASECPHLAYMLIPMWPDAQKILCSVLSTLETATRLIGASQSDKLPVYIDAIKSTPLDFCRSLWTDFKRKYHDQQDENLLKEHKESIKLSSDHDEFNVFHSMIEIFQAFGDEGSMNIQRFLFMLDYFDFEERYPDVSRKEVINIFENVLPNDASAQSETSQPVRKHGKLAQIDYTRFKAVFAEISSLLDIPIKSFVKGSLIRIEMKRLFAEHSFSKSAPFTPAGNLTLRRQRSAHAGSERGARPIVIDCGGFFRALQACHVTDQISFPEAQVIFKNVAPHDAHLLKFSEFYTCLVQVAGQLEVDLLALITPFRMTSASERRVCILNLKPSVIKTGNFEREEVTAFCNDGVLLAELFAELEQDTYALGIMYLVLTSCYDLENFSELSQANMSSIENKDLQHILQSFNLISDCSVRLARFLLAQKSSYLTALKAMKKERSELDGMIQARRRVRNRRRNAEAREDSMLVYEMNMKRLDQLNAEILDRTQEVDEISREIHELRRRAHTCAQAIQCLVAQDTRLSTSQLEALSGCVVKLQYPILQPENEPWKIPTISLYVLTRLLHAVRQARNRLEMQREILQL